MKIKILVAFAYLFTETAIVNADVFGSGSEFAIPDNNPAGNSSTITFTADEVIHGNVVVTLNSLTHTYVGDLVATLIALNSTSHHLFFRIGRVNTGFGDSSNCNGNYVFTDNPRGDPNSNSNNID